MVAVINLESSVPFLFTLNYLASSWSMQWLISFMSKSKFFLMYSCAIASSFLVTVTGSTIDYMCRRLIPLWTGETGTQGVWSSSYCFTFSNNFISSSWIFYKWLSSLRSWFRLDYFCAFLCSAKDINGLGGKSPAKDALSFLFKFRLSTGRARYDVNICK